MKNYIAAILFFCIAIKAEAQLDIKPGLRAGTNLSTFSNTGFDGKADFYAGGYFAVKFTNYYTFQPELTYSRQGAAINAAANEGIQDIEVGYLSFGLINKRTLNDFNILLGPSLDFQIDSNVKTNSKFDLGFIAGLGYTLPFGVTVEARAKFGVIDVLESDNYKNMETRTGGWNTNMLFQAGLSYTFAKSSDNE